MHGLVEVHGLVALTGEWGIRGIDKVGLVWVEVVQLEEGDPRFSAPFIRDAKSSTCSCHQLLDSFPSRLASRDVFE